MTSPSLHLKVVLPSDPRYLPVVRGAISPLAAAIGWDESGCREITLALDEALPISSGMPITTARTAASSWNAARLRTGWKSACWIAVSPRTGARYVRARLPATSPADWELISSRM